MHESNQIVRPLRRGEILPAYSTAHLLLQTPGSGAPEKKLLTMKREEKELLFAENYNVIKRMLSLFATNVEIADAVGVPVRCIKENIHSTEELRDLCDLRVANLKAKGCESVVQQSRNRFASQKEEILRAMETEAMYKVARQFGFSLRALKRYVNEEPNRRGDNPNVPHA